MFKILLGIMIGFSAGTCAGIIATKFRAVAKVHKDLVDEFRASENSERDETCDRQEEVA